MPQEKRHAFLGAFSELPQKILWKWEADILPGQPPNVKLGKWLPQQDILGKRAFCFDKMNYKTHLNPNLKIQGEIYYIEASCCTFHSIKNFKNFKIKKKKMYI
jgi:hypothetical protein